eukprot:scaffold758_cov116-Skeletonema_marinoi.AAC.4
MKKPRSACNMQHREHLPLLRVSFWRRQTYIHRFPTYSSGTNTFTLLDSLKISTTMMEEAPIDNKRRRISAAGDSPQSIRCLTDLPSGILAHAASFLAEPSKALFAIALDGNSAVSPNERSAAIVGNQWSILDFGGIEKELAVKLNDDDIEKVLLCIDAVNRVKRLKLTNCVNITGVGLEPLRGSLIIEQIDLSLVGSTSALILVQSHKFLGVMYCQFLTA